MHSYDEAAMNKMKKEFYVILLITSFTTCACTAINPFSNEEMCPTRPTKIELSKYEYLYPSKRNNNIDDELIFGVLLPEKTDELGYAPNAPLRAVIAAIELAIRYSQREHGPLENFSIRIKARDTGEEQQSMYASYGAFRLYENSRIGLY